MLVNHPQADRDRVVRRPDLAPRAVNPYLSLIGRVEAVKDLHDGRFARPVFANDSVDGVGGNRKVDPFIRSHRAEAFDDTAHFDNVHNCDWAMGRLGDWAKISRLSIRITRFSISVFRLESPFIWGVNLQNKLSEDLVIIVIKLIGPLLLQIAATKC